MNPAWDATLRPSRIPTSDGEFGADGKAILSVRQSRLGVDGQIPTRRGDVAELFSIQSISKVFTLALVLRESGDESEAATNQRNQAIAALMMAYGRIKDDREMVTDVYTHQCSLNVKPKDLATFAIGTKDYFASVDINKTKTDCDRPNSKTECLVVAPASA